LISNPPKLTRAEFVKKFVDVSLQQQVYNAARKGRAEELAELLHLYPAINVNQHMEGNGGRTALQAAAANGHDSVVALLLAHPDIDVNLHTDGKNSPLHWACYYGETATARLLLGDARVFVNQRERDGHSPLFWAAFTGRTDIIKWWISLGREIDLGQPGNQTTDVLGVAIREAQVETTFLLERYKSDPEQTRSQVRAELASDSRGNPFPTICTVPFIF